MWRLSRGTEYLNCEAMYVPESDHNAQTKNLKLILVWY